MIWAQQIQETIAYAPTTRLKTLADRCLENSEAEVVVPPQPSLTMARVKETVDNEVFNLGEVLVTTCEVLLDGVPGWGMVLGQDAERALCAAVVDAASRREDAGRLLEDLEGELVAVREARRSRWAAVQSTRVEFEEAKP